MEAPSPAPPTPLQQQDLAAARQRAKRIYNAARVATFNGWTTGIAAAISFFLCYAFSSVTGAVVAIALCVVTFNEFRGRRLLLRFDPRAMRRLGFNQLGFMGLLVGYGVWKLYAIWQDPNAFLAVLHDPQIRSALTPEQILALRDLLVPALIAAYGTLIVLSLFFQGLNALYYFTRTKYLREYIQKTPAWILDVQRSGLVR